MSCRKARYWIQLELDGELTTRDKTRLASHLTACPSCREVRRQLATVQAAMKRMGEPAVAIDEGLPFVPGKRQGRGWLVAAAAVLAAGIGLWLMVDRVGPRQQIVSTAQQSPDIVDVQPSPEPSQPVDPRTLVRVQFEPSGDVVVVPRPTQNTNITILWIYPTFGAADAEAPPAEQPRNNAEGVRS